MRDRFTVAIDRDLMAEAMAVSGLKTKRATIEAGLTLLVKLGRQGRVRETFGKYPLDPDVVRSQRSRFDR